MRIPISRSFEVFDTNDCCLMDGTIKRYNQVPVSRGMYGTVLYYHHLYCLYIPRLKMSRPVTAEYESPLECDKVKTF